MCSLKNPNESTASHRCQVIEFTKEDLLKDDPPQEPAVPEEEPADEEQVGSRICQDDW